MTQMREDSTRGKAGKGKAIIKKSKTEMPSRQQEAQHASADSRRSETRQPKAQGGEEGRDPQLIAKIQQRAYGLFAAAGYNHGHDLEHWLEAERQITGTPDRAER
jgi:hypothetical protein